MIFEKSKITVKDQLFVDHLCANDQLCASIFGLLDYSL